MQVPVHLLRKIKYSAQGWVTARLLPADTIQRARGKLILCYHGIDNVTDTSVNTKFISSSLFEQHLKLLKQHTNVISLNQYINNDIAPDKLNVAITFDDGFKNNYTLARPLLERYNVPATFFITPVWHQGKSILWADLVDHATPYAPDSITIGGEQYFKKAGGRFFHSSGLAIHQHVIKQNRAFVNKLYEVFLPYATFMQKPDMDVYWQLMSPDEIVALSSNKLFTIGSHGYTHTSLPHLADNEMMYELTTSKQILEELMQKTVEHFAPPFGHFDSRSIANTRAAGYTVQSLVDSVKIESGDPYLLPRLVINPYISAYNQLLFIANGRY